MTHPAIIEVTGILGREPDSIETIIVLAAAYLQERDALDKRLRYALCQTQTYFNDCPICNKETLWQYYEDGDESGWGSGGYCTECEYDPASD